MTNTERVPLLLPEEAGWYLFHKHACHGPYTRKQVVQMIAKKQIEIARKMGDTLHPYGDVLYPLVIRAGVPCTRVGN